MPAEIAMGPTVLHVGERSPKDKKYAPDEYVYANPGVGGSVVVAPRKRGEKPTMRNALKAVMGQMRKSGMNPYGQPVSAAGGAAVTRGMSQVYKGARGLAEAVGLGARGAEAARGARGVLDLEGLANFLEDIKFVMEQNPGLKPWTVRPSAEGGAEVLRTSGAPKGLIDEAVEALLAQGRPRRGIEGMAGIPQSLGAMPELQRNLMLGERGLQSTGHMMHTTDPRTAISYFDKMFSRAAEAQVPIFQMAENWGTKLKFIDPELSKSFKGFMLSDGRVVGSTDGAVHHQHIVKAVGLPQESWTRGGDGVAAGLLRLAKRGGIGALESEEGMAVPPTLYVELAHAPTPSQMSQLLQAMRSVREVQIERSFATGLGRNAFEQMDDIVAQFPDWEGSETLRSPVSAAKFFLGLSKIFPDRREEVAVAAILAGVGLDETEWRGSNARE